MKYLKKIKVLFLAFAFFFVFAFGVDEVRAESLSNDVIIQKIIDRFSLDLSDKKFLLLENYNTDGSLSSLKTLMVFDSSSQFKCGYEYENGYGSDFSESVSLNAGYGVLWFEKYTDDIAYSYNYFVSSDTYTYSNHSSDSFYFSNYKVIDSNCDIVLIGSDEVFFCPPTPTLPEIAQNLQMNQTLFQVVSLVPLLIALLAGYLALRKALAMLREILLMG